MKADINSFGPSFEERFRKAQKVAIFVRGQEFQESAISDLDQLIKEIQGLKDSASNAQDEDNANGFLALELMATGLQKEILCYVKLKNDRPAEAWNALVDAESSIRDAIRAHRLVKDASGWLDRIEGLQRLLFPQQMFFSMGWRVRASVCSICEKPYEECEHILGRPYMAKICYQIVTDGDILEASLVERPADKRCRIESFSENGNKLDTFTLRDLLDLSNEATEKSDPR